MKTIKKQYTVDLAGVRSAKVLHRKIAEALPVPKGYGCNYDALHDFLTEFGSGMEIVFVRASASFSVLRHVCDDAAGETPGLSIAFKS